MIKVVGSQDLAICIKLFCILFCGSTEFCASNSDYKKKTLGSFICPLREPKLSRITFNQLQIIGLLLKNSTSSF